MICILCAKIYAAEFWSLDIVNLACLQTLNNLKNFVCKFVLYYEFTLVRIKHEGNFDGRTTTVVCTNVMYLYLSVGTIQLFH